MTELHIPEYGPHECVPTQDAYDATVRALEKHRARADSAETAIDILQNELRVIRDLAYRGSGPGARDAVEAIFERASKALGVDR
jgi:hypothetical protein